MMFVLGFLVDGSIAVCGLCAMDVVPKGLAGSAHGLACAVAQGKLTHTHTFKLTSGSFHFKSTRKIEPVLRDFLETWCACA